MFTNKVWHPGLRLRILAPAILVAVPALALLVYMSFDRRQQAGRAIDQNTEQMVRLATVNQERLIEGTRQLLVAVSQSKEVRAGNIAGCLADLQHLLPQFGATYNNIGVTNARGEVICSGLAGAPVSIADRPYYQAAMASRGFTVGEYSIGRMSGRAGLPFAYPVIDNAGSLSGVVFAIVDLERLNQSLIDADWPPEVTVTVTDRSQTVIAQHPEWQKWVGQSLKDDVITKAMGARDRGAVEFRERDEDQLIAFARVIRPADTGLTVRVFVSKTQAMAAANRAMYEGLVALGFVSLLVMAGIQAASERLIIRPIVQLTGASRRAFAPRWSAKIWSSSITRRRRWMRSDVLPEASRTISTTCSRPSLVTASCCWKMPPSARLSAATSEKFKRPAGPRRP